MNRACLLRLKCSAMAFDLSWHSLTAETADTAAVGTAVADRPLDSFCIDRQPLQLMADMLQTV